MSAETAFPSADEVDWAHFYEQLFLTLGVGLFGFYAGTQALGQRVGVAVCGSALDGVGCSTAVAKQMRHYELVPWFAALALVIVGVTAIYGGPNDE